MRTYFDNLQEILQSIKNNSFNREYSCEIASAYIYDENQDIKFNEKSLDSYGFLFHFLLTEQFEISDNDFKYFVNKILDIKSIAIKPEEIKKVLYEKQLIELKLKFDKKIISENIYKQQIEKYLSY